MGSCSHISAALFGARLTTEEKKKYQKRHRVLEKQNYNFGNAENEDTDMDENISMSDEEYESEIDDPADLFLDFEADLNRHDRKLERESSLVSSKEDEESSSDKNFDNQNYDTNSEQNEGDMMTAGDHDDAQKSNNDLIRKEDFSDNLQDESRDMTTAENGNDGKKRKKDPIRKKDLGDNMRISRDCPFDSQEIMIGSERRHLEAFLR